MHRRWIPCMAVFCLTLAGPLEGQDAQCSYTACALRLDEGVFRSRILAGEAGTPVANVGGFGTDLETQLALPDSALFHVQRANGRFRTGTILSVVGLASTLYGSFASGDLDADRVIALVVGGTLTFGSEVARRRGRTELNHGLWWYNRELSR